MYNLWEFIGRQGDFVSDKADKINTLYLPLCNEALMSSISPDLHGDIKNAQNSFLLEPVSRINLISSRCTRNFWVYKDRNNIWSATGVSKDIKQIRSDSFKIEAGLLWQKIIRENKNIGLKSEITSYIPSSGEPLEVMLVQFTNIWIKPVEFIPIAAIPIYARGANNIRDHRHVTSLLHRIITDRNGVIVKPTLSFDEAGHSPNQNYYFVLGFDGLGGSAEYIYPTQESFCGDAGDLEAPQSVLENILPDKNNIQGKEAMGALRFRKINLAPGKSFSYIVLLGISDNRERIKKMVRRFNTLKKAEASLQNTKKFWVKESENINLDTKDILFDNWLRWVKVQPVLRKIFGCSFLPDFDYGKGGRGWRDLWQDCLGLILSDPFSVRKLLINNFSGVRIDGSNATIIGKKQGEFLADRNDIARVWMDHGVWPLITTDLYINETGDLDILFREAGYFCDQHIWRSRKINPNWSIEQGNKLRTVSGKVYKGTVFEHLLVQNLVQFLNVGEHNHVRLEGADWNDGLDMADKFGESVAFSAMYAGNLNSLARLLLKSGKNHIRIAKEVDILLKHFDYGNKNDKRRILERYFTKVKDNISGKVITIDVKSLVRNLQAKALWMGEHISNKEWLREGFFNGYYDNSKRRIEGRSGGLLRMSLAAQVFPIMSGVAKDWQIKDAIDSVKRFLFDSKLGGYRLNTDFKQEKHDFGRAFSFAYGEKENGAVFSHMVVMYAYALYSRGFVNEGWKTLSSLYRLAVNTKNSKIYPCLPEYFNGEGRGMYSYLTGSASWFILTLLNQSFGLRGQDGDLLIEPKLTKEQFKYSAAVRVSRLFAGKKINVIISNPMKLDYGEYKIVKASLNLRPLPLKNPRSILISSSSIIKKSSNNIHITLG